MLIFSSVGANRFLASKSQNRQNTLPPRKHAGIISSGLEEPKRRFTRWGVAMPTKEIGPAKDTIHADSMLERRTSHIRKALMFTPMFWA